MSELTQFTGKECLRLEELPPGVSVEDAMVVAGALNGLVNSEHQRVLGHPNDTDAERSEGIEASMRVVRIMDLAEKVTGLVRRAVTNDEELLRIAQETGLTEDPLITIDLAHPYSFIQPSKSMLDLPD